MKALFFWFNLGCPVGGSIGVGILSAELKKAGHDVRVIHLNDDLGYPYDEGRISRDIAGFAPDVAALSFGGNHVEYAKRLSNFIKRDFPEIKVICGGVQSTIAPDEVLSWPGVDMVYIGEADQGRFADFLTTMGEGREYRGYPGLWIKENARIIKNTLPPPPDISSQTLMDFDAFDMDSIIRHNRDIAEVCHGRGCNGRCTFCQNSTIIRMYKENTDGGFSAPDMLRYRDIDNIIEEMKEYLRRFPNLKAFSFSDDIVVRDKEHLRRFMNRYREEIGLPFFKNSTVQHLDEETADLLQYGGCRLVRFGIESGVEQIRKNILKKYFTQQQLHDAIKILHERDINARGYIIIGIPTEIRDDIVTTLRTCADARLDTIRISILYPFAGTEIRDFCIKHNLLKTEETPPPTNVSTSTALKWDPGMELFINRCIPLSGWLLNSYLGTSMSERYRDIAEAFLSLDDVEWEKPETSLEMNRLSSELMEECRARKIEYYYRPFPERPDLLFLERERKRPFPE